MSRRSRPCSREGCARATLIAAVLLLSCLPSVHAGDEAPNADDANSADEDGGEVAELAAEIVSDSRYQTEMPGSGLSIRVPAARGFATVLMWVLIGAGAILIGVWLANLLVDPSHREAAVPIAVQTRRDGAVDGPDLDQVERLALEQRYDEAVHAMLLISIRQLGRRLPGRPSASTTSRELLRALPLSPGGRRAFGELVRQVERSLFGGQPLGAEQYARCRSSFGTLLAESRA